jgi:acetoin utilization deacetylase AcuC-like enzyme
VSTLVWSKFEPSAIIVQCGADCLNKDPLGHFSLTLEGVGQCVERILSWNLPTLFLGGGDFISASIKIGHSNYRFFLGGYNLPNAARLWTYLTSIIADKPISNEIPEHKVRVDLIFFNSLN